MKNKLFQTISTNDVLTKNGAVTNSTSLNPVLDLFFLAGACRNEKEENIEAKLQQAFSQDRNLTLKLIFWAGDIRGGAGERRFFRIALKFLEKNYPEILAKFVGFVPFYNRWDSVFGLKPNISTLSMTHYALAEKDGLCAKWMPRQHSKKFEEFRKAYQEFYKIFPKEYRKLIVGLTKTVEQQMTRNDWQNIIYEHVPSVAMNRYRKVFYKKDEERFSKYIEQVKSGEKKINASAIFPHDIYKSIRTGANQAAIEAQWNALPNYMADSNEMILPVCDVSGSMSGTPMAISVALGIYISERNRSVFKDGFITFSSNPKLQYLKGSFVERVRQLENAEWEQTTNLQAVFALILGRALSVQLPQSDMPTKLLIISDMEFDAASYGQQTNFQMIKEKYKQSGYEMPQIVFWNVNGRVGNSPVTINDKGVALISGASPSILKSVLGGSLNPEKVMLDTLNSERYSKINL